MSHSRTVPPSLQVKTRDSFVLNRTPWIIRPHHRNAGWPTGRESQGHRVPVGVGGGESPDQAKGDKRGCIFKGKGR
jgi:hypothetical protein